MTKKKADKTKGKKGVAKGQKPLTLQQALHQKQMGHIEAVTKSLHDLGEGDSAVTVIHRNKTDGLTFVSVGVFNRNDMYAMLKKAASFILGGIMNGPKRTSVVPPPPGEVKGGDKKPDASGGHQPEPGDPDSVPPKKKSGSKTKPTPTPPPPEKDKVNH